jgi:cytidine deaminase
MKLLKAAAAVSKRAYAPYSRFEVGAALLSRDGAIFTGCNVENASYGLTICAERSAVCSAVAAGHTRFVAIAIVASGDRMPYPCGACRQVLAEFGQPDLVVLIAPRDRLDGHETYSLAELLPKSFHFNPNRSNKERGTQRSR